MKRRIHRKYGDVLYTVSALADVLYPCWHGALGWIDEVYATSGIQINPEEEPTIGQLYAIEAFLIDEIQKLHEETETLLAPPSERAY